MLSSASIPTPPLTTSSAYFSAAAPSSTAAYTFQSTPLSSLTSSSSTAALITPDSLMENPVVCPNCVTEAVKVASAVYAGELDQRVTCDHACCGIVGPLSPSSSINTLKNAVNAMADHLQRVSDEVLYVAHETAVKGKLGVQVRCDEDMNGVWQDVVVNLNSMTRNHLEQVRDIADVSTAIARGDLSKAMTVPVIGETLLLKDTFNTMGKPEKEILEKGGDGSRQKKKKDRKKKGSGREEKNA
jgi:HAMP domain-containing protein